MLVTVCQTGATGTYAFDVSGGDYRFRFDSPRGFLTIGPPAPFPFYTINTGATSLPEDLTDSDVVGQSGMTDWFTYAPNQLHDRRWRVGINFVGPYLECREIDTIHGHGEGELDLGEKLFPLSDPDTSALKVTIEAGSTAKFSAGASLPGGSVGGTVFINSGSRHIFPEVRNYPPKRPVRLSPLDVTKVKIECRLIGSPIWSRPQFRITNVERSEGGSDTFDYKNIDQDDPKNMEEFNWIVSEDEGHVGFGGNCQGHSGPCPFFEKFVTDVEVVTWRKTGHEIELKIKVPGSDTLSVGLAQSADKQTSLSFKPLLHAFDLYDEVYRYDYNQQSRLIAEIVNADPSPNLYSSGKPKIGELSDTACASYYYEAISDPKYQVSLRAHRDLYSDIPLRLYGQQGPVLGAGALMGAHIRVQDFVGDGLEAAPSVSADVTWSFAGSAISLIPGRLHYDGNTPSPFDIQSHWWIFPTKVTERFNTDSTVLANGGEFTVDPTKAYAISSALNGASADMRIVIAYPGETGVVIQRSFDWDFWGDDCRWGNNALAHELRPWDNPPETVGKH